MKYAAFAFVVLPVGLYWLLSDDWSERVSVAVQALILCVAMAALVAVLT